MRMLVQRECVLMVDRRWGTSQFNARARRQQMAQLHFLKMWGIATDAIVLGARRKLHVFAQQVFDATVLIGCVVT